MPVCSDGSDLSSEAVSLFLRNFLYFFPFRLISHLYNELFLFQALHLDLIPRPYRSLVSFYLFIYCMCVFSVDHISELAANHICPRFRSRFLCEFCMFSLLLLYYYCVRWPEAGPFLWLVLHLVYYKIL